MCGDRLAFGTRTNEPSTTWLGGWPGDTPNWWASDTPTNLPSSVAVETTPADADVAGQSAHEVAGPDRPLVVLVAGVVAAVALVGARVLGMKYVVPVVAGAVVVADALLMVQRWSDLRAARKSARILMRNLPRSAGFDSWVAGLIVALALVGTIPIACPDLGHELERIAGDGDHRLWPFRGMVLSFVGGVLAIHVSALVDWAVIRPRLLGTLGTRSFPCQAGRKHSTSWRLMTRVWLGHRIAAYLLVRVGLVLLIAFAAAALIDPHVFDPTAKTGTSDPQDWVQPLATVAGAVAAAIFVFFLNRLMPVLALVMNPRLAVGDRVVLAEEFGAGVANQPEYYVVDVAIEGVKLLQLGEGGQPKGAAGKDPHREHDRSLSLADVPRLVRFRGRFSGCDTVCCKANHNCPLRHADPVPDPITDQAQLERHASERRPGVVDG